MFSQSYDDVDKKIRDLTDELYIMKRFARVFSIAHRVVKIQDIGHNNEGSGTIIDDYQYCGLLDCLFGGGLEFTFIPRWVEYFNSYNPKPLPELKLSTLPMNDIQVRHMYTKYWLLDGFKNGLNAVKGKCGDFRKKILLDLDSRKAGLQSWSKNIKEELLCFCTDKFNRK